jgi:hypothetical protein
MTIIFIAGIFIEELKIPSTGLIVTILIQLVAIQVRTLHPGFLKSTETPWLFVL